MMINEYGEIIVANTLNEVIDKRFDIWSKRKRYLENIFLEYANNHMKMNVDDEEDLLRMEFYANIYFILYGHIVNEDDECEYEYDDTFETVDSMSNHGITLNALYNCYLLMDKDMYVLGVDKDGKRNTKSGMRFIKDVIDTFYNNK